MPQRSGKPNCASCVASKNDGPISFLDRLKNRGFLEADKQGRILIPAHLRKYAGIDKECVVTGNLDKVEIWSPEKWAEQMGEEDDLAAYAAQLDGMGVRL